jgi:hypothetical protein
MKDPLILDCCFVIIIFIYVKVQFKMNGVLIIYFMKKIIFIIKCIIVLHQNVPTILIDRRIKLFNFY